MKNQELITKLFKLNCLYLYIDSKNYKTSFKEALTFKFNQYSKELKQYNDNENLNNLTEAYNLINDFYKYN